MNPVLKIVLALATMILAFCAVFVPPLALLIPGWIPAIASGLSFLGIKSWRKNYTDAYTWFKSKTIWGALGMLIPMVLLFALPSLGLDFIPEDVKTFLNYLLMGGGGLTLVGIYSAVAKNGDTSTYIKAILIIVLPSLLIVQGCSSSLDFQTDTGIVITDEPQQLAEIIDAAYASYEAYEVNQDQKINVINLAFDLYPKIKTAINDSKAVLIEVKKLTRPQILSLTNLGDKYDLGIHKEKFKQVIYMALGLVQSYYVFSPQVEADTTSVSYYSIDPEFLVDPGIKTISVLH